jgi:hypothetical protein
MIASRLFSRAEFVGLLAFVVVVVEEPADGEARTEVAAEGEVEGVGDVVKLGEGDGEDVSDGVGEGEDVSLGVGDGEVSMGLGEGEGSLGDGDGVVSVGVGEGSVWARLGLPNIARCRDTRAPSRSVPARGLLRRMASPSFRRFLCLPLIANRPLRTLTSLSQLRDIEPRSMTLVPGHARWLGPGRPTRPPEISLAGTLGEGSDKAQPPIGGRFGAPLD